MSRVTGKKKKKKTRQGQTPAGALQPVDASASADVPEIPSAMEVEAEELLPLPEVGARSAWALGPVKPFPSVRHLDAVFKLRA